MTSTVDFEQVNASWELILTNVPILDLLKTPENVRFFMFSMGIRWEHSQKCVKLMAAMISINTFDKV